MKQLCLLLATLCLGSSFCFAAQPDNRSSLAMQNDPSSTQSDPAHAPFIKDATALDAPNDRANQTVLPALGISFYRHFGLSVLDPHKLDTHYTTCQAFFGKSRTKEEQKEEEPSPAHPSYTFMTAYQEAARTNQTFFLYKDGKKYRCVDLGKMLAIANFIHDVDCIGREGGSLGFCICDNQAQVTKTNAASAFRHLVQPPEPNALVDHATFFAPHLDATLGYDELTPQDQKSFLETTERMLKEPRENVKQLIDKVVKGHWSQEQVHDLLDHLLARKALFLAAFPSLKIDKSLSKEIDEAQVRISLPLEEKAPKQKIQPDKEQWKVYQKRVALLQTLKKTQKITQKRALKLSEVFIFQCPKFDRKEFTGREEASKQLAAGFIKRERSNLLLQMITGPKGVGKTMLATHYLHAAIVRQEWIPYCYDAILWFNADIALEAQLHYLAKLWGQETATIEEATTFIYNTLKKYKRTLILFDNTEGREIAPYLPPQESPKQNTIDILLTSRHAECSLPADYAAQTLFPLHPFTKEEAREHLLKQMKGTPKKNDLDKLWQTVGGSPLALTLARQYIAKSHSTLKGYPRLFSQYQLKIGTTHASSPVVASLLLSLAALQQKKPFLLPLLLAVAYPAHKGIPQDTLHKIAKLQAKNVHESLSKKQKTQNRKKQKNRRPQDNPKIYRQQLKTLQRYGLLIFDKTNLSVQRFIQTLLRRWHHAVQDRQGREELVFNWIHNLEKIQPVTALKAHLEKLEAELEKILVSRRQYLQESQEEENTQTAAAMENLTNLFIHLGMYEKARRYLEKVLQIRTERLGINDPKTVKCIENLGFIYNQLGRYQEAKEYYEKALRAYCDRYGEHHLDTVTTMENLGKVLCYLAEDEKNQAKRASHYEEAKYYLTKALNIRIKQSGKLQLSPRMAILLESLGCIAEKLDNLEQAEEYYQKLVKLCGLQDREGYPDMATVTQNLGKILYRLGKYKEAQYFLETALNIQMSREEILPIANKNKQQDLRLATVMDSLGILFEKRGQHEKAEGYYKNELEILQRYYREDQRIACCMLNLGHVRNTLGRCQEAKKNLEQAYHTFYKVLGENDLKTAAAQQNLGISLSHLGEHEQAKKHYEEALKVLRQHHAEDDLEIGTAKGNIGNAFLHLFQYKEAQQYLSEAFLIFSLPRHYGKDHPETAKVMVSLGALLCLEGSYKKAKVYLERALKIEEECYGKKHLKTTSAMENLGIALKNLGNVKQGKAYLEQALAIRKKHLGEKHPLTLRTKINLNLSFNLAGTIKGKG